MPYGHRGLLAEIRHLDERTKAYDVHVQIHVHSMARACMAAQQSMHIIRRGHRDRHRDDGPERARVLQQATVRRMT